MNIQRYFKTGQRVQLRAKNSLATEGRQELLGATLEAGDPEHFVLRFPYGPDTVPAYPIVPDMPFELSADAMGLGIKVSVRVRDILGGDRIRVRFDDDLQMFQRRTQPRLDCILGLHLTRRRQALQSLRQEWEKSVAFLAGTSGVIPLDGFETCELNLSSGGVRIPLPPPAEPNEVCLLRIALPDRKPPVCVLAEIIWVSAPDRDGQLYSGMRFINILEQDQQRITQLIRENS